jgi:hypothetical protein
MTLRNLVLLAVLASLSGCYTTTLRSGKPSNTARIDLDHRWHHGVIWGIAELSGPYNLKQLCPNGWGEIQTETSFVNGLLHFLTSGVYAPQTVTVRCSGEEPEPEEEAEEESGEAAVSGRSRSL